MKKLTLGLLFLVGFMFLSATPAQAYVDPGSGSLILQLLLGGVASGLVMVKMYWKRIRGRLILRSGAKGPTTGEGEPGPR